VPDEPNDNGPATNGPHTVGGEKRPPVERFCRRGSRWRTTVGAGGPAGNERLTAAVGLVLFVLLAVETLTWADLHSYLSVHLFLGLLLLPPLALKLASTGWRFLRYYTHDKQFRLQGPPQLLLRLLAPFLVASTLLLFGSGVALIAAGHGGGLPLKLHQISFVVWGVLVVVHVLAYLMRTLRVGPADWRPNAELVVAGVRSRRAALGGALLAGVIIAAATYPAQHAFKVHSRAHPHAALVVRPRETVEASSRR
jgi:hypothetical protein